MPIEIPFSFFEVLQFLCGVFFTRSGNVLYHVTEAETQFPCFNNLNSLVRVRFASVMFGVFYLFHFANIKKAQHFCYAFQQLNKTKVVIFYIGNLIVSICLIVLSSPFDCNLATLSMAIRPPTGFGGAPLSICHPFEPSPYSSL